MDIGIKINVNKRGAIFLALIGILCAAICTTSSVYSYSKNEKIKIIDDLIENEIKSMTASELAMASDVNCDDINSIMDGIYSQRGGAIYRSNDFLGIRAIKNGNFFKIRCYFDGFRKYTAIQYSGFVGDQGSGNSSYKIYVFNK